MLNDEELKQKAQNNTPDNFCFSYEKSFMDLVISRMENNEEFFKKMLENSEFKSMVMEDMFEEVYSGLKE